MNEWVKVFHKKSEMEDKVNAAFEQGYKLIDFQMKICYGSYAGQSIRPPEFAARYFVHMKREDD
jgi:hypothetical protein